MSNEIVFSLDRDGGVWQLYRMRPDGTGLEVIPNTVGATLPTVSPDGSWIAYTHGREIWRIRVDGLSKRNLTMHPSFDQAPAWSPDGRRIAFHSDRSGLEFQWDVFVMDPDGADVTQVTDDPGIDGFPTWSPDGSSIAFSSRRDGNYEVYLTRLDGQPPLNLTNHQEGDTNPQWSPDGGAIAFRSSRALPLGLFLMGPDGGNVRQVPLPFIPGAVAWSPDGTRLIVEEAEGSFDLWVGNLDGSGLINLTNHPSLDLFPTWIR